MFLKCSFILNLFSWDFIYAEYVMAAGHHHQSIVWQIAEDYSHCEFLICPPGYCPMPAFCDVIDSSSILQPAGWTLKQEYLPDDWLCLVCGVSDTQELPPTFIKLEKNSYMPDFIAASDCMLGKIGYGTVSGALAYKLPFVFVRRDYFNGEPFLRNMLEHYQGGVEMIRRDLLTGRWALYLLRAVSLQPCYEEAINGGEVAAKILQDTAVGKNYASSKLSGARRLRDAIVLGFQLQRAPGRDADIPDWFAVAETELGLRTASPKSVSNEENFLAKLCTEEFELLHGSHHGLPDTLSFLNSLAELDTEHHPDRNIEKRKMREFKAAAGLFNWE
ncbi:L-arabinokinase, partial [Thalictrum thalictroides]